jgi:hypothetical protein
MFSQLRISIKMTFDPDTNTPTHKLFFFIWPFLQSREQYLIHQSPSNTDRLFPFVERSKTANAWENCSQRTDGWWFLVHLTPSDPLPTLKMMMNIWMIGVLKAIWKTTIELRIAQMKTQESFETNLSFQFDVIHFLIIVVFSSNRNINEIISQKDFVIFQQRFISTNWNDFQWIFPRWRIRYSRQSSFDRKRYIDI